jgi:hypothetical protein
MTISTLGPNFPTVVATGGTVTEITAGLYRYKVHTFTSSGTFDVSLIGNAAPFASAPIEYLIVAGGGGGGGGSSEISGGGGAGGYLEGVVAITAGSYSVVVGAGGANGSFNLPGFDGANSTALNLTSVGGGGGGRMNTDNGRRGGSGGGSKSGASPANFWGEGTFGQGNRGGAGWDGLFAFTACGGGGGAGAVGGNAGTTAATSGQLAVGGDGLQSSINGTATYYAGGGGGGTNGANSVVPVGVGGLGGGGSGGAWTVTPTAGTANTGGGGGGNGASSAGGAAGGSGIVILRYPIGLA